MYYSNIEPAHSSNVQIKSTSKAKASNLVNNQGWQDWSTLDQWMEQDPSKNLLEIGTFFASQRKDTTMPFYYDILKSQSVLETKEVNGLEGKFTYQLPVETDNCMKTTADLSADQENAGAGQTYFFIELNRELSPNTRITCDALDGEQLIVADEIPVSRTASGFYTPVKMLTGDPDLTYPAELLQKDIEYFEIGNGIEEYNDELGKVHMPEVTNYNEYEFTLGTGMGYETATTMKADSVDLRQGMTHTKDLLAEVKRKQAMQEDYYIIRQNVPNYGEVRTVATVLEMLAVQKYVHNMSVSLMFGKGGTIKGRKGTLRYNEGLWPQMRRGFIVTYGRRGGLQRTHIKQARDYIFSINPTKDFVDSELRFDCGSEIYDNFLEIFSDEVVQQLGAPVGNLLGADRLLPSNIMSGDLHNLNLDYARVTSLILPGIGKVKVDKNNSLNRTGMVDKNISGMHPNGYDYTTYTAIVWDAYDQSYSNNMSFPQGVEPVGDNKGSNIWMVVPEGDAGQVHWGRQEGRYSVNTVRDIMASSKKMTTSFFIYGFGAIWMKDPSRFVMIELDKKARKGYN